MTGMITGSLTGSLTGRSASIVSLATSRARRTRLAATAMLGASVIALTAAAPVTPALAQRGFREDMQAVELVLVLQMLMSMLQASQVHLLHL